MHLSFLMTAAAAHTGVHNISPFSIVAMVTRSSFFFTFGLRCFYVFAVLIMFVIAGAVGLFVSSAFLVFCSALLDFSRHWAEEATLQHIMGAVKGGGAGPGSPSPQARAAAAAAARLSGCDLDLDLNLEGRGPGPMSGIAGIARRTAAAAFGMAAGPGHGPGAGSASAAASSSVSPSGRGRQAPEAGTGPADDGSSYIDIESGLAARRAILADPGPARDDMRAPLLRTA